MKIIKCELCGSNKLTKIDGEYICDYCHTHYTTEEAKKLIINGPVEITGNIQLDNSLMINNYKKLAKRAFNDKLYAESYDYYQKILELDPDDWEAVYKKGLCSAKDSTLFTPKLEELINSSKNSINIIKNNNLQINLSELMYNMAYDINSITLSFYNLSKDYYLDNKLFGKLFIKLYYFISPKVVKVLGKSKYFKLINKYILNKFILVLNNKGYKNTIYNDKY